ncbi:MAG TPA: zf-HC2 domain-containing protein [Stellaceae bacterium]|nr:zf-HC2 domain-containing protein [Stellaceae bacterium]
MLSCKDVSERASRWLDREMGFWERLQLRSHLAICVHCRRYLAQFKATVAALRFLPDETPDDALAEAVMGQYRNRIERESG